MSKAQKGMTVGALGMLLGIGLCGVDQLRYHGVGVLDRNTPFVGLVLIVAFAAVFVVCLLAFLVQGGESHSRRRR